MRRAVDVGRAQRGVDPAAPAGGEVADADPEQHVHTGNLAIDDSFRRRPLSIMVMIFCIEKHQ